jgi:tRNA(Ile2) C34 agmatinyltransferase TiaS
MKADPAVPMNCPICGTSMLYVETEGQKHYYRCPRHGLLMLPPDGRFQKVPEK